MLEMEKTGASMLEKQENMQRGIAISWREMKCD